MKYTIDTLKKINGRFCGSHCITEADVEMANRYVELIENTRSMIEPKTGDVIEYTNEYGDYYGSAHIEKVNEDETVCICEQPYVPFIGKNENDGIWCSTSGGAWCNLPINKLVYIGKREKTFCDWGNCGCWADGAVNFNAEVSVWEYVDENNKFVSGNGYKFTTKDFNKYYVAFNQNRTDTNYIYFTDGKAWANRKDYQAWLRTFRAEVFKGYWENQFIVWTWKNIEHQVSPTEFDNLDLPEDTFKINGDILRCKRKYNEDSHTIDTYYVWYWDEPEKDFFKAAAEQNKIRKEKYVLPYNTPEYQVARRELKSDEYKLPKMVLSLEREEIESYV